MPVGQSRLEQIHLNNLGSAGKIFRKTDESLNVPLVLVPGGRSWVWWGLMIPQEANVVWQNCGKELSEGGCNELGYGWKWVPPWKRIAYLVTKQSCTYNAPVQGCPTSDNVMVEVDIQVQFTIENPANFVYRLGAVRFDGYLKAAAEEAIRDLVRHTEIAKVYELRGSKADQIKQELGHKFEEFGVKFSTVVVTGVEIPKELAKSLARATEYESKHKNQTNRHEANMKNEQNLAVQDETDLQMSHEKLFKELNSEKERAVIEKEKQIAFTLRQKDLAVGKAREKGATLETRAKADLNQNTLKAEKDKLQQIKSMEGQLAADKIVTDEKCMKLMEGSKSSLIEAENKGKALIAESQVEAKAAKQFKEKRANEIETKKLQLLQIMASSGKIMISGDQADTFIKNILSNTSLNLEL